MNSGTFRAKDMVNDILRDKCVAIYQPSVTKLPSMLQNMSGETSGDAVCNGNPTVKAMLKNIVNGNA